MTQTTNRRGRGRAAKTLRLIDELVKIAEGINPCTVRAVAYQVFVRKLIDSMAEVTKVSRLGTTAREEGTLPWEWIVDEQRQEQRVATWADPAAFGRVVQAAYKKNKWQAQPTHVSVWSEKATVAGTLRPVLEKYEVPFQITKGWCSSTTVMETVRANFAREQDTLILYVGDYDPSGMYMSEVDLPRRLARYSSDDPSEKNVSPEWVRETLAGVRLEVRRIALTRADTLALGRKLGFPAKDKKGDEKKKGDPRYDWFIANHGDWCWELDALNPNTLRDRVEEAIVGVLDVDAWERYVRAEEAELEVIEQTCRSWASILQQDQE